MSHDLGTDDVNWCPTCGSPRFPEQSEELNSLQDETREICVRILNSEASVSKNLPPIYTPYGAFASSIQDLQITAKKARELLARIEERKGREE